MGVGSLVVGLIVGGALGALLIHFWTRNRQLGALGSLALEREQERGRSARQLAEKEEALKQTEKHAKAERDDLNARLIESTAELRAKNDEVVRLSRALSQEQEHGRGLARQLTEQKAELEQLQARMTTEFENIANRLLAERGKELNVQQQEKLGDILKPLQERIKDFEEKVQKAYDEEGRQRFALKSEIGRLVEQNQRLSQEADNLTKALKGDTQAQGAWGEMILEKLLESSGLVAGQEYTMQSSTTLDDGSRLRPDAVVMLPEGKHLIIDSKVSLVNYERFTAADPSERDALLVRHVESLRAHARDLSGKDYKHGELVKNGERGVWSEPLLPGKYAFNTYAGKIIQVPTTNFILKWITAQVGSHRFDENLAEVSLITKDAFEPSLPLSVVVHIDYRKAPLVIQRFGDIRRLVEQTLDPMISAYFKNVAQTRTLIQLLQDRSEIQAIAGSEMRSKFEHYNLELEEVLIGTPGSAKGDTHIEVILAQLRERQIAEEQVATYALKEKAATKERELNEAQALKLSEKIKALDVAAKSCTEVSQWASEEDGPCVDTIARIDEYLAAMRG